jgi:hypothetical protein
MGSRGRCPIGSSKNDAAVAAERRASLDGVAVAPNRETGLTYTAVLTPGEDGWICAQIAEVPEAISQGGARWRRPRPT